MENDAYPAGQALNDVAAGSRSVADRLITPPWFHPILGLGYAGFILGVGLLPAPWSAIPSLLFAIVCGALIGAYSRLTGILARPRIGRRSGTLWLTYSVIIFGCTVPALFTLSKFATVPLWVLILTATVAATTTMVLGPRIDAAMRDELRTGTARARTGR